MNTLLFRRHFDELQGHFCGKVRVTIRESRIQPGPGHFLSKVFLANQPASFL